MKDDIHLYAFGAAWLFGIAVVVLIAFGALG